jgi:hypothetical protein
MKMTIKQQIEQVVAVINDLRLLHPNEKQIPIHPAEDLPEIPKNKIDLILKRLDEKEWVLNYIQPPSPNSYQTDNPDRWNQCFIVEPLPSFTQFAHSLKQHKTTANNQKVKAKFNKQDSSIEIGNASVKLPYAKYEYLLAQALFSKPKKRWENDELAESMAFDDDKYTAIYDTYIRLNDRISSITGIENLILYGDKTYQLNPKYL